MSGQTRMLVASSIALAAALIAAFSLVTTNTTFAQGRVVAPVHPAAGSTYMTHISTDKPIYRSGEKVFVRVVMLDSFSHSPVIPDQGFAPAQVEIRGPKGDVVAGGWAEVIDSVAGFSWTVPQGQAGGEYSIKVTHPNSGQPPAERNFDIRAYRAPRIRSQIVFLRDGYGPGDQVVASLSATRAEGGIPADAKVIATARVDGEEVYRGETTIDRDGNAEVRFDLPAEITRGEGTIALTMHDGGVVETATKTIPILLQTLDLQLYPEGGELVVGVPARVYIEAKQPNQKPADIAGVIVDDKGVQVAEVRTAHEGRGLFAFTPQSDRSYKLRITEPAGIKTTYDLPAAKATGVALQAVDEVVQPGKPVRIRINSNLKRPVQVTLNKRDTQLVSRLIGNEQFGEVIELAPGDADGVLAATVWDADGKPLAERLIFRQPVKQLNITVTPTSEGYTPGDAVELSVKATDGDGKPVEAMVGLTVTDDSVLEMIETREQAPRLPVMVLLEPEVRELADAQVYLDKENPQAPQAVDLLLGTQGWRRFATLDKDKFVKTFGDDAKRVVALREPVVHRYAELRAMPMAARAAGGLELVEDAVVMELAGVVDEAAAAMEGDAPQANDMPNAAPPANGPMPVFVEEAKPADVMEMDEKQDMQAGQLLMSDKRMQGRAMAQLVRAEERRNDFVTVRIYSHEVRPDRQPGDRVDFAETLYWTAGIRTDARTGLASVKFALSDSVTSYRIFADGFDAEGAIGSAKQVVESVQPFYVEPKMPLEITVGDRVNLPVGIVNNTTTKLAAPKLTTDLTADGKPSTLATLDKVTDAAALDAKARQRWMLPLTAQSPGNVQLAIGANTGAYGDRVTRTLRIVPRGFPVEVGFGGMLEAGQPLNYSITIPQEVQPGSMKANITVSPTPLANMTEALERLIREPSGCFEQTSSNNYPLIMAQAYFMNHTGVDPALVTRSQAMLDRGYAKLTSFETKEKGYEWFGSTPPHEALTAYGLMEFVDMSQVHTVDPAMIQRTREWLLSRRDDNGGFKRSPQALDSFGRAPEQHTNAYITWALLEAGETDIDKQVKNTRELAKTSDDSYVIALAANALAIAGDTDAARAAMARLADRQTKAGDVSGATTTITNSGGEALAIETTALATLAWLREPSYTAQVEKSMNYLAESCKNGRFGSTQSTILALRAINEYDKQRAVPLAPGKITLLVDGKVVGEPVTFTKEAKGVIEMPDASNVLGAPGEHRIELQMADGSQMPASVAIEYYTLKPNSSDKCKLTLDVTLGSAKLAEGKVTEATVVVTNASKEVASTPVAIIGIPGGLEVRHDQLKELVKAGRIAAYEVIGREVVLYWRGIKAGDRIELPISLVAEVPGNYTAPASRVYEYYTDELKQWQPGLAVTIDAAK